jgi:hypothetical protein
MALYVGIDVSKEKFDACGIGAQGKKTFSVSCSMNREGFDKLILALPSENLVLGIPFSRRISRTPDIAEIQWESHASNNSAQSINLRLQACLEKCQRAPKVFSSFLEVWT